jgi:hypothetical protein
VGNITANFWLLMVSKVMVREITVEYQKHGAQNISKFVTDAMLDSLTVYGTVDECIKSLKRFTSSGISLPILQVNPVNDNEQSIKDSLLLVEKCLKLQSLINRLQNLLRKLLYLFKTWHAIPCSKILKKIAEISRCRLMQSYYRQLLTFSMVHQLYQNTWE